MEPEDIIENHLEEITRICDSEFADPDDSDIFHVIDRMADINPESRRFYYEVGNIYYTMQEVMEAVERFISGHDEFSGLSPDERARLRQTVFDGVMIWDGEGYCPDTYLDDCDEEDIAAFLEEAGIIKTH